MNRILGLFFGFLFLALCSEMKGQVVSLQDCTPDAVVIVSQPSKAKVYIDGEYVGETPLRINKKVSTGNNGLSAVSLEYGDFHFKDFNNFILVLEKDGYEDYSKSIFRGDYCASATEALKLSCTLTPKVVSGSIHQVDNSNSEISADNIIRWSVQSSPSGARIFWRVISNTQEVKNTNETYLTNTPYEETRPFNIKGLTCENSNEVTVEIKVTKKGYADQVKRFNVRQAMDQQEINTFFELVAE